MFDAPLALQPPGSCRIEILRFLEIFFRSQSSHVVKQPRAVSYRDFLQDSHISSEKRLPVVRLRAVRAHSVKMGPDMHCSCSSRPITNVPAFQLVGGGAPAVVRALSSTLPPRPGPVRRLTGGECFQYVRHEAAEHERPRK